ncbi:MAG: hypothetical protein R3258_09690 [Acidimicrobiia bacterium]|nr:hypothetical protein [Acidimicrobiia bacterium]
MELRDVLLFFHILGAAGWIGGGAFGVFVMGRFAKAGGPDKGRALEFMLEKATPYGIVVVLLTVLGGVGLVVTQEQWGWGDTFVWFGIVAIIVEGTWESVVHRKKDEALIEAIKEDSPNRLEKLKSWYRTAWVSVAILLVALWAMVTELDF